MRIEEIDLDTLDFSNIRETDEGLDLLGDSLLKGQQSPIIVGPALNSKRLVFDGNRRVRAAMLKGIRFLNGIVTEKPLTADELVRFQLVSDVTKEHLTYYERAVAIIRVEDANPNMSGKELAALIDMDASLIWKYQQARKLSPVSMEAFKAGKIGLTTVVELAKLPHGDQPVLLDLKLSGASRDEVRKSRKSREVKAPAERTAKIKVPLVGGATVTVAAEGVSMEEALEAVQEAAKQIKAAIAKGIQAKSAMAYWRDLAAAN